jgi:hypothetical protein
VIFFYKAHSFIAKETHVFPNLKGSMTSINLIIREPRRGSALHKLISDPFSISLICDLIIFANKHNGWNL